MLLDGGAAAMDVAAKEAFRRRPEVPLPDKLSVVKTERGIEIRRRWFQPIHVFLLFFCIAWDGFLVFWYSMATSSGAPLIMKIFPVAHVAVGLGLSYFTLAGFLNTTTISIERRELRVSHAPLPWRGALRVDTSRVDQLYCKQEIHRGKHGISIAYAVMLVLRDKTSKKLVAGLTEEEQALFVEQQIERALGIADRPMPNELER